MSMKNVVFAAVLAGLCAALPAPASAQLGFIKKQLKQKIVHTVVDSALNRVAGAPADSTATAAPVVPAAPAVPAESRGDIMQRPEYSGPEPAQFGPCVACRFGSNPRRVRQTLCCYGTYRP